MLAQSDTQKNSSPAITPEIRPQMHWRVAEVRPLDGFRLHVRFLDGVEGEVQMAGLIHSPTAGVFTQLSAPEIFEQVFVAYGAVTWPGEIDLAPDAMYANIKETGKWVLT